MSARYTIAGDWGTSRLRLFRLVDGAIVDRAAGPGIGALQETPAATLRNAIAPWVRAAGQPAHVVLCGMAGARTGLAEAPYAECPAGATDWRTRAARIDVEGLPVAIAAGLACLRRDGAPDVMRGEETQVFGAQSLQPALARGRHRLALPGTHSKWAWLEDGHVTGFRTVPTGELFALLRAHSTLIRAGPAPGHEAMRKDDARDEPAGFDDGLARARAGDVLGQLFEVRAAQLRAGRSPGWALGFLSGLLIGHEVREALAEDPADDLTLVGDPALSARYARALEAFGARATLLDGDACALSGLQQLEDGIAWT